LQIATIGRSFSGWLEGFTTEPIATAIGSGITVGLFFYVIYVQSKLFPDLVLFMPKKIKGQYVFSD
jgi:hypothetical protein